MATVLEGSGNGVLDRAAGHIEHTALPGMDGNVGIAGHRDTIFRPLQHVRSGQLYADDRRPGASLCRFEHNCRRAE
jgi:sortase A